MCFNSVTSPTRVAIQPASFASRDTSEKWYNVLDNGLRHRFVLNAPAAVNGLRRTVAFYAFHSHVDLDQSVEKSQSIFIRAMCAHKLPASKWSRHWCFKHLHIDYKYQTCDADLHPNYQLQTRTRRKTVPNSTNNNNYVIQNNANTFIYSTQAT